MNPIEQIEAEQKKEVPSLKAGQTVRVHVKVVEGEKERTQVFEGVVIGISGKGSRSTFTVRKISYGVGRRTDFSTVFPALSKRSRSCLAARYAGLNSII